MNNTIGEECIWYFQDRPCKNCYNFDLCCQKYVDSLDEDQSCVLDRLSRIVVDGMGDCWNGEAQL